MHLSSMTEMIVHWLSQRYCTWLWWYLFEVISPMYRERVRAHFPCWLSTVSPPKPHLIYFLMKRTLPIVVSSDAVSIPWLLLKLLLLDTEALQMGVLPPSFCLIECVEAVISRRIGHSVGDTALWWDVFFQCKNLVDLADNTGPLPCLLQSSAHRMSSLRTLLNIQSLFTNMHTHTHTPYTHTQTCTHACTHEHTQSYPVLEK